MGERIPTLVHGPPEDGGLGLFMRSLYKRRGDHLALVGSTHIAAQVRAEAARWAKDNEQPLEVVHPMILRPGRRSSTMRIMVFDGTLPRGMRPKMVWVWGTWPSRQSFDLQDLIRVMLASPD